jgi:hypothetical protein
MPLSLLNHSALALFAQRTRIPTSARSIGFCAIWVCISSSSSSIQRITLYHTAAESVTPKKSDWTEHLMLEAKNAHLLFSCASAIKLRSIIRY